METLKKKRGRPSKASRAVVTYNAKQAEIDQIKSKLEYIHQAARRTLPMAIEVGEWFAKQRARINGWGEWEDWIKLFFPEYGISTIRHYVQLASEKQFLEAKFALSNTKTGADIQALPTFKEALKAIAEKNKPIRRGAGRIKPEPKTIEVTATSMAESLNGTGERATRIVPPAETLVDLLDKGQKVEHPDATTDPKKEIDQTLAKATSCARAALTFVMNAVAIAEAHNIPIDEVVHRWQVELGDEAYLATCFTGQLLR